MRKAWCSVCSRAERAEIDRKLLDPRNTLVSLAKEYGTTRNTLQRHRDRHLADKASQALEIHRQVSVALEAASTGSAIDALIGEAQADRKRALERNDHRLALRAIDTLLKAHELHARLVIEAGKARASDISSHPVFRAWLARIAACLCGTCSRAVADIAAEEMGIAVPVTVHPEPADTAPFR